MRTQGDGPRRPGGGSRARAPPPVRPESQIRGASGSGLASLSASVALHPRLAGPHPRGGRAKREKEGWTSCLSGDL